ncbi:hypothetical protein KKC52_09235 [bacterium]|nr:hypothetical protein [bacterium]
MPKEEVWDRNYPRVKIDRELTLKYANRHRGSIRISTGLFYTKEEFEKQKRDLLRKKLP